jgi:hypothetical protein
MKKYSGMSRQLSAISNGQFHHPALIFLLPIRFFFHFQETKLVPDRGCPHNQQSTIKNSQS